MKMMSTAAAHTHPKHKRPFESENDSTANVKFHYGTLRTFSKKSKSIYVCHIRQHLKILIAIFNHFRIPHALALATFTHDVNFFGWLHITPKK